MADVDERPPPLITISDPTRPGEPVDVMVSGDEKEPWRPTRRHWTALAVLVLLAVAAVVPDRVVSARAADRRAELAAVDGVELTLSADGSQPAPDAVRLLVQNTGPSDVRLLEVQVDGYPTQRTDVLVPRAGADTVDLKDTVTCTEKVLLTGDQNRVRLRLRTPGGTVVTRRLDLTGDAWLPLAALAQKRCGYLSPGEALKITAAGQVVGRALDLRVTVRNTGRVPLRLDGVNLPAGFDWRTVPAPPTSLPASQTTPTSLLVRLTVNSCPDAQSSLVGDPVVAFSTVQLLSGGAEYGAGDSPPVLEDALPLLTQLVSAACGA